MIEITPTDIPLEEFTRRIQKKEPFTFSRWGDGEWRSVMGKKNGANCDGHPFFPEMCRELQQVLLSKPPYLMGMQQLAMREFGDWIRNWLEQANLGDIPWVESDVFHKAAHKGYLDPFVEVLRKRRTVIVGPEHLMRAQPLLNFDKYVSVPTTNAYLEKQRIVKDALACVDDKSPYTIFSISASMPAEIIVDELWKEIGERHAIVDFGSLWDQYVGVKSRSYMRAGTAPLKR